MLKLVSLFILQKEDGELYCKITARREFIEHCVACEDCKNMLNQALDEVWAEVWAEAKNAVV
jgi:hypothetical protein